MAAAEGSVLPLEVLVEVFSHLEVQEIEESVAPVCRLWRDASRLPVVRRKLKLTDKIAKRAAHAMLRRSPLLTELRIELKSHTDDLLRTAAKHNLKLRVLTIGDCVSDIGLEAVAQCSQLHTLSLHNMSDVTDDGVVHLVRLRHLQKLKLDQANSVTNAGWRRLFTACEWSHLRELDLWLFYVSERDVPRLHFERLCTTLHSIELGGAVSDIDLMAMAQCDRLRTLSLCGIANEVTDDGVVHLAPLSKLEKLQLCELDKVTAAGWRRLFSACEWPHLRELRLELCHTDRDVPQVKLERLHTTLRSIDLCGTVSDVDLVAVAQCDQLRTLSLRSFDYDIPCHITDDGVVHLTRLHHLETLKLYRTFRVKSAGWRRLLSMCEWPHLRELGLWLSYPDEGDVPRLQFERLPTLRSIELRGFVSDIDLQALAQCDQLRTLSLRSFDLDNSCHITDDGVVHLARLRNLETLALRGRSRVTPAGWRRLFSICEWPHLRTLRLPRFEQVGKEDTHDLFREAKILCPDFRWV